MNDYAYNDRKALIAGIKLAPSNGEKLAHALRYLGNRHVLHAEYQPSPRHAANSDSDWARYSILRGVGNVARAAGRI